MWENGLRHPLKISIHALREESDLYVLYYVGDGGISIHALREESDKCGNPSGSTSIYFNPRSP